MYSMSYICGVINLKFSFLGGIVAVNIVEANRRINQITGESWVAVQGSKELVCPHGVMTDSEFAFFGPSSLIRKMVAVRHVGPPMG